MEKTTSNLAMWLVDVVQPLLRDREPCKFHET